MLALDDFESADAAADINANLFGNVRRDFQAAPFMANSDAGDGELDKSRHLLDLFFFDPARRIEVLYLAGNAAVKRGGVELRDGTDAAPAFQDRAPSLFGAGPDRRHQANTGDDYSSGQIGGSVGEDYFLALFSM